MLGVLFALSLWVIASDLALAAAHHVAWTHTDGFFAEDQLQYLAWIQASAGRGLISDMYVLRPTAADYLQPAILISGLLVRAGVSAWLALLIWKPVGVVMIFAAARTLTHRCLDRRFDRRIALVLALLFASITEFSGSLGVFGDMVSVWQSWGYPFGLIGVALAVFALLRYAAARDASRVSVVPGLLAALAGLLHPWQGELTFGILALAELARAPETVTRLRARRAAGSGALGGGLRDAHLRLALLTLALVALPLAYYFALGHLDPVWRLSQAQAKHAFSSQAVLIAAAPLLAFALLGYRGRPVDFLELELRMWIPTVIVIWLFSLTDLGATPQHAVNGLPLAMAVLAVLGARRCGLQRIPRGRALAVLGTAIGVLPGTVYLFAETHDFIRPSPGNPNFVSHDVNRALTALHRDPAPGGVLAVAELGDTVPGLTGRHTYVGDCLWSQPHCAARTTMAHALLTGAMSPAAARRFVATVGIRFVVAGCRQPPAPVTRTLGALVAGRRRFGCATLWRLRPVAAVEVPGAGSS